MQTLDVIKSRRAIRAFTDQSIPDTVLDTILEAGTWAPSGMGRQSSIIIAATSPQMRNRLSAMNAAVMGSTTDPFYGAPTVVCILSDRNVPTHVYDGALVAENIMLAAADQGVASCYIFRGKEMFDSSEGKAFLTELGIEGDYEGNAIVILGYAAQPAPTPKPRKEGYIITC